MEKIIQKSTRVLAATFITAGTLFQPAFAFADSVNANPNSNGYSLSIPKNASKVFINNKNHVNYQVDNAVNLTSDTGQIYTAPETVDSQVTGDVNGVTSGISTVSVDLSQAQEQTTSNNNLLSAAAKNVSDFLFGTPVSASTSYNQTYNSKWDSTSGVKIYETVYWSAATKVGTTTTYDILYKVSGGYTKSDSTINVKSSSVFVAQNRNTTYQQKTWSEGTSSSWSISTGFTATEVQGSVTSGATYTVNLNRGSSNWSVALGENAFTSSLGATPADF